MFPFKMCTGEIGDDGVNNLTMTCSISGAVMELREAALQADPAPTCKNSSVGVGECL